MPYIKKERRNPTESPFRPINSGELNFRFSKLASDYISDNGMSYQTINDLLGALEGAKLELYRRIAVPYENEALVRNGDVYNSED